MKDVSQFKMPYTITRRKTISGKLQLLPTPFPPFPSKMSVILRDRHATCQDHLIFNHVMGIYFLELKVLQMCTDLCLSCV